MLAPPAGAFFVFVRFALYALRFALA